MRSRHSLLLRQLKRHFPNEDAIPPSMHAFLDSVDAAYHESDIDRGMLERSLDLSSQELLEANSEMMAIRRDLETRVQARTAELSAANAELKTEIAERERFEAKLVHSASHDPLTDLFNRRHFEQQLEEYLQISKRTGSSGSLFFLDLDQFKDVNDTLGHGAGDQLLRSLVGVLRSCLRETDVLARIGGDEFAVLLPETSLSKARAVATQIEEAVRRHAFWLEERPISVTASIGVASFPRHGENAPELLSNADLAMYQAKANGRSRVELFRASRDLRSHSETRLRWRNLLVDALERDNFALFAQPIRRLDSQEPDDYEILLRLPLPSGNFIRPGVFMDIAEDFGLAPSIDRWVVRNVVQLIVENERRGRHIRLAVNLSGKSLADNELLSFIRSALMSSSIDPDLFVPEITETAAIANLGQAQKFIRTLKDLGCQFSLDDFGSGFSSFYHLKHLAVDYLKIDGAFIRDLPRNEVDRHLVQAIVAVARGLGKRTIAEFVGDDATVHLLKEYGVDYAQGYHIGRPRDVNRVLEEAELLRAA